MLKYKWGGTCWHTTRCCWNNYTFQFVKTKKSKSNVNIVLTKQWEKFFGYFPIWKMFICVTNCRGGSEIADWSISEDFPIFPPGSCRSSYQRINHRISLIVCIFQTGLSQKISSFSSRIMPVQLFWRLVFRDSSNHPR